MDIIFLNSESSKISDPHRLLLNLSNKINFKRSDKYVALPNFSIKPYKNNKFKISALTWIEKFELPNRSYYVSDIQDYFKYILKKLDAVIDNPSIRIYINKIENRITFKIKKEYYLELLIPQTMMLIGSTKSKVTTNKNGENVSHLEITELVLMHCNIVNNDYQQD